MRRRFQKVFYRMTHSPSSSPSPSSPSPAILLYVQTVEPTQVTISGTAHSLSLAVSMVQASNQAVQPVQCANLTSPAALLLTHFSTCLQDIVRGSFKGFALLRQVAGSNNGGARAAVPYPPAQPLQAKPLYAPGYGLIPPSQVRA